MIAAGRGLSAAHKAGLVHRDFKPGNVIVGDDGRVRVLDFGLARAADQAELIEEGPEVSEPDEQSRVPKNQDNWQEISSDSSPNLLQSPLTHAGGVLGTPLYMAPEQHLGLKTDERTDQFGFCVVLYEVLYGRRPFSASSMEKLKNKVILQRVSVPKEGTGVPDWLWQIIYKGLSAKPDDRYPTIDSLLEDLDRDPEEVRRQKRLARRRKVLLISFVLLTVTLPIGVWYGLRYRTVQLCKAAEGEFEGVWDETTKSSIEKSFSDTHKSYAKGTWKRVEKCFDKYLNEWLQMRSDVCEARWVRGTQSDELFDLRMSCLQSRKRDLKALAKVFASADSKVVEKAIQASSSLDDVSMCADEKALRSPYPPPQTADAKAKVETIREKLSGIVALERTGKYREGLKLVQKLEEEASAVNYRPVQAEVLYWLGKLFERVGDYKKAETTLYRAARAAAESNNVPRAAEAMVALVWIVGDRQSRPEEGLSIGRDAEVVLGFGGRNDDSRARLCNNLGNVYINQGNYDKALEYYRKTLAIWEKLLRPNHPRVSWPLYNIGNVFHVQGKYEKALEYHLKALEIFQTAVGPEHPGIGESLYSIATVFRSKGEYDKALEYFCKAQTIWEKALGTEHPYFASLLSNIGNVFIDQGKFMKALDPLERVVSLCEKKTCEPELYGLGLFGLARSLLTTGVDKERAIKLAKQAREIFGKTPKAFKKELEEVNTWLQKHGASKLAKKAQQ